MRPVWLKRRFVLAASCLSTCLPSCADVLDPQQPAFPRFPPKEKLVEPKEGSLETLFPHAELTFAPITAYPLEGTKIPTLTDKSTKLLGLNNFVVINNTSYKTFADVYRDNRLKGKPNFVTADALVHPYIAFTNGVAANVIAKVAPDLQVLLIGMYNSAGSQYKNAQDASLRNDAEKNCAYLGVALKLLNPALQLAPIGQSASVVAAELQNIQAGKTAKSVIFDRVHDFSVFKPIGWYSASPQFANFYRCHQWLSRTYFTLSDPDTTADDSASSEFRRSVLLFQNLQQSKVGSITGVAAWLKISSALDTIGTIGARERLLLVPNYAAVFAPGQKLSLAGLSEPFYRTKLLLSIRRQRPLEVGAASIFNPTEQKSSAETTADFRLFPPTYDPELDWLRSRAHGYTAEGTEGPDNPLALFTLYAHGAGLAGNMLGENIWHMDPELAKVLPSLMRTMKAMPQSNSPYSLGTARWQILASYFKPAGEGAQPALKSALWAVRRLESSFAGWVDGQISVAPLAEVKPAAKDEFANMTGTSAPAPSTVPPAKFHYLEPSIELYKRVASDADELAAALTSQGYITDEIKTKLADFQKLAARLSSIAEKELSLKPIPPEDMQLLAGIDKVLDKVSFPVQGSIHLNSVDAAKGGCNLALGRPGYLHVICHTTRGVMLCRGAVYTYYEIPGAAIKPEHWDRKLEYTMVRPPSWVSDFDLIQEGDPSVRATK